MPEFTAVLSISKLISISADTYSAAVKIATGLAGEWQKETGEQVSLELIREEEGAEEVPSTEA